MVMQFGNVGGTQDKLLLHLVNLESVKDFEGKLGRQVDPLRFRANIAWEGGEPWEEWSWVGQHVQVGEAILEFIEPTVRCPATQVLDLSRFTAIKANALLANLPNGPWRLTTLCSGEPSISTAGHGGNSHEAAGAISRCHSNDCYWGDDTLGGAECARWIHGCLRPGCARRPCRARQHSQCAAMKSCATEHPGIPLSCEGPLSF